MREVEKRELEGKHWRDEKAESQKRTTQTQQRGVGRI
jgi:hypothetical protein